MWWLNELLWSFLSIPLASHVDLKKALQESPVSVPGRLGHRSYMKHKLLFNPKSVKKKYIENGFKLDVLI